MTAAGEEHHDHVVVVSRDGGVTAVWGLYTSTAAVGAARIIAQMHEGSEVRPHRVRGQRTPRRMVHDERTTR